MLVNNSKYLYSQTNSYLESLYYDRCSNNNVINKLILLKQTIFCNNSTTSNNKSISCFQDRLFKSCCNINSNVLSCNGINIIKDDTLNFYINNPECCPIPLWQIIRDNIIFKYNIITKIKSPVIEKQILTTIIKNNINSEIIEVLSTISKNDFEKYFIDKNIKNSTFDILLQNNYNYSSKKSILIKEVLQEIVNNNLKISISPKESIDSKYKILINE